MSTNGNEASNITMRVSHIHIKVDAIFLADCNFCFYFLPMYVFLFDYRVSFFLFLLTCSDHIHTRVFLFYLGFYFDRFFVSRFVLDNFLFFRAFSFLLISGHPFPGFCWFHVRFTSSVVRSKGNTL